MYLITKQPHALRIRALIYADLQGRLRVSDIIDYVGEGGTHWEHVVGTQLWRDGAVKR
jgi:hypothetical protein